MLAKLFKRNSLADAGKSSIIIQRASVTLTVTVGGSVYVQQLPCANNDFCAAIERLVAESDLPVANSQCQIVLGHGMYQLAQMEKPAVPDSELTQALTWSAKDLISIASENIILDYFSYLNNNPNNNKINVVACDKSIIKPITDLLSGLDVEIKNISIVDIVLSRLLNEPTPRVLVFHLPNMNVIVAVIKEGQLCFSRHIKGYDNLHQMSDGDFQAGGLNNLGLEIQRCIDFAVGQLKLDAITGVSLLVQSLDTPHMASALQDFFDIDVSIHEPEFAQEFNRYPLSALALAEMELAD